MQSRHLLALAFAASLTLPIPPAAAQGGQGRPPAPPAAGGGPKAGHEADLLPAEPVVSQHTGKFNGQTVSYTAEVGWIPIRDEGKVVAKMFYVGYTKAPVSVFEVSPRLPPFVAGHGDHDSHAALHSVPARRPAWLSCQYPLRPTGASSNRGRRPSQRARPHPSQLWLVAPRTVVAPRDYSCERLPTTYLFFLHGRDQTRRLGTVRPPPATLVGMCRRVGPARLLGPLYSSIL